MATEPRTEHVYDPVLTRGLKDVASEMSLQVLAYNMKRVIAILGAGLLIAAIRS